MRRLADLFHCGKTRCKTQISIILKNKMVLTQIFESNAELICAKHTRELDVLNMLTSIMPYISGIKSVARKICTQVVVHS